MGTILLTAVILLPFLVSAIDINEQCQVEEETLVDCRCIGNEEFFLPEGYNYENVTSVRLSTCVTANLHFSSLTEASRIEEIIVQNITERLSFELFLTSRRMKTLRLSQIRKIPLITHDTFTSLHAIETFHMEDTFVERFQEQFTDILVTEFLMLNVTIGHMDGVNFSERGKTLRIIGTELQNVTESLNFAYFSTVTIRDSKFLLQKPRNLLIGGNEVIVENSVFSNASINLVAGARIGMTGTCAYGKSSLRLSSDIIESSDNRLPTEIVYTKRKESSQTPSFLNRNNTVCIAGNCRCPKRSGQSAARVAVKLLSLVWLSTYV